MSVANRFLDIFARDFYYEVIKFISELGKGSEISRSARLVGFSLMEDSHAAHVNVLHPSFHAVHQWKAHNSPSIPCLLAPSHARTPTDEHLNPRQQHIDQRRRFVRQSEQGLDVVLEADGSCVRARGKDVSWLAQTLTCVPG